MSSRELKLVFEDQWLVVVEKPAGLLSISTGRGREKETTAYSILKEHFGELFIVHRLDRDTSGLIVFAKDHDTKLALQENWYEAVLERKYVAILEGRIEDEEGWIETWLFEHPKSMKVHCYALRKGDNPDNPPQKDWHYASTHCRTLKHGQIDGDRTPDCRRPQVRRKDQPYRSSCPSRADSRVHPPMDRQDAEIHIKTSQAVQQTVGEKVQSLMSFPRRYKKEVAEKACLKAYGQSFQPYFSQSPHQEARRFHGR